MHRLICRLLEVQRSAPSLSAWWIRSCGYVRAERPDHVGRTSHDVCGCLEDGPLRLSFALRAAGRAALLVRRSWTPWLRRAIRSFGSSARTENQPGSCHAETSADKSVSLRSIIHRISIRTCPGHEARRIFISGDGASHCVLSTRPALAPSVAAGTLPRFPYW